MLVIDMLNAFISTINGGSAALVLDEDNRLLVTAFPESLADGGIVTLQFRKLLSVLQVTSSCAPGHTHITPRGDSVNLDSANILLILSSLAIAKTCLHSADSIICLPHSIKDNSIVA